MKVYVVIQFVCAFFIQPLVLMQLWGWFLLPTFNIPVPTLPMMMGLSLIWTTVSARIVAEPKKTPDEVWRDFSYIVSHAIGRDIAALVIGFIFHLFI